METLLHIGTDKTGSTAIQMALFHNRAWFLERSVYVPETGLGIDNGHASLLQDLDPKRLSKLDEELHWAKASGFQRCIISWEGMCRYSQKEIKTLSEALPEHTVKVLVYLREQAEVIQSAHLQWVQMNAQAIDVMSLARPESIFHKVRQALFLRQPKRNYLTLLKRWRKHYPNANIHVRPFDPKELKNSDVVCDFLNELGLTPDEYFATDTRHTNPSLDLETTLMLQNWRLLPLSGREIDTRLDIAMSIAQKQTYASRYFFEKTEVEAIRTHYHASNQAVPKLANISSPDPLFTFKDCWREEPLAEVVARADERDDAVTLAAQIPTLWKDSAGDSLATGISFKKGWSVAETWGVWSNAKTSELVFRIPGQALQLWGQALDIQLVGRYYGDNSATRITLNGTDFGERDLSNLSTKLRVELEHLGESRLVHIVLQHQDPTSPHQLQGSDDFREIAFALCALSYEPVVIPRGVN